MTSNTLLIGCGKMGGALLKSWIERGMAPSDVSIVEPDATAGAAVRADHGANVVADPAALAADFRPEVVVFAVKPQGLDGIAPDYRRYVEHGPVFLSIAAGKPIAFFESALGSEAAIVRTMPNTPAAVQRGITAACANPQVSSDQRARCQALLEGVGSVVWLDDESLLDPVTAVSGSGPAYVFLLIECMTAAGIAEGLPADVSAQLAQATVAGSGELARLSSEPAAVLRQNVTSPGGTTEAALKVLMGDDGLEQLMKRAVNAATRRSRELGS